MINPPKVVFGYENPYKIRMEIQYNFLFNINRQYVNMNSFVPLLTQYIGPILNELGQFE